MHRGWRTIYWLYCAAVLAFLLVPIAAIVPLSFSSGSFLTYPLPGWSLRWYEEVLGGGRWLRALGVSLTVGACATALSVLLGTLAALGLARERAAWATVLKAMILAPMIVPVARSPLVSMARPISAPPAPPTIRPTVPSGRLQR